MSAYGGGGDELTSLFNLYLTSLSFIGDVAKKTAKLRCTPRTYNTYIVQVQ